MKKYDEISKKEVYICNCCGQMIASVDECDRAAFLDVSKAWDTFQSGMAVFIVSSSVRIAMGR